MHTRDLQEETNQNHPLHA